MDKPTLYAQIPQEIDGKRYELGDPIDADLNPGIREYLVIQGSIGSTRPNTAIVVPPADKPLEDMSRAELEATARAEAPLDQATDQDLIDLITRTREARAKADAPSEDQDGKPTPLTGKNKADLLAIAEAEGVTTAKDADGKEIAIADATNAQITDAITAKRVTPPAE